MNLNVETLINTCRNGIEIAKRAQVQWDADVDDAEAAWEHEWATVGIEKWRPLRDKITKALRTGGPIVAGDMPFQLDRYSNDYLGRAVYRPFNRGAIRSQHGSGTWTADHEFGPRPVLKINGFEALIEFLGAITDKSISTAQLERAGFRNMSKLFEAAANGVWE